LDLDIPFYTLSGGTKLDAYSTKAPSTRTGSVFITGLASGETLLAIDFRPATGQLYGVSSGSRLYIINQNTGVASAIGSGAFTPAVAGNLVGFDFNPMVDRIRLVTSTGQNLRLNPETGTVAATDGMLNGAAGATITGAAYTNNTALAGTTVLYTLDPATDKLYRQDPPNEGKLVEVGALNLNISGDGGFDIDAKSGTALGLFATDGGTTLFTVNTQTGATQMLAKYESSLGYTGLAIPTQPVAYAVYGSVDQDAPGQPYFAVNDLFIFDLSNPAVNIRKRITGLPRNEEIIGVDFRPANGQLYVLTRQQGELQLTSSARLFTLNVTTAAATLVGTLSTNINGFSFGFDFNPVVDRIRIVSSSGQNLRVNPANGVATVDGSINPGAPFLVAAAYDNSFAGATATKLYVVGLTRDPSNSFDPLMSVLYEQNSPNAGTVTKIGDLGSGVTTADNLDIGGTSNIAYSIIGSSGAGAHLHNIDLASGTARRANNFNFRRVDDDGLQRLRGLAIGPGF
jgi:hypothetical protein